MYLAAILSDSTLLCIPVSWCYQIDIVNSFNNGLNHNKKKTIFFSKNEACNPNFLLPVKDQFDDSVDSCYNAMIKRAFAEKKECIEYLKKRRVGILPPVYNEARTREIFAHETDAEAARQINMERKFSVKQEVTKLRNYILNPNQLETVDLTESDTEDYEAGLNIDLSVDDENEMLIEEQHFEQAVEYDAISGDIEFVITEVSPDIFYLTTIESFKCGKSYCVRSILLLNIDRI